MSILIDTLMGVKSLIDDQWSISKPLLNLTMLSLVKDAVLVLRKKAIAVHFREDIGGQIMHNHEKSLIIDDFEANANTSD